jgi:hypothetical protein
MRVTCVGGCDPSTNVINGNCVAKADLSVST